MLQNEIIFEAIRLVNGHGKEITSCTNFGNIAHISSAGKICSPYFLKSQCLMHPLRDLIFKTGALLTHCNYVLLYDCQNQRHFFLLNKTDHLALQWRR